MTRTQDRPALERGARDADAALGVFSIRYDCANDLFHYGPEIGKKLRGSYDSRPLWTVLRLDGVATEDDITAMERLLARVCLDETASNDSVRVLLATACGALRHFCLRICVDAYAESGATVSVLLFFYDIEESIRRESALHSLSKVDSLTGLLTRTAFLECVDRRIAVDPVGAYMIAYFDVDKFGVINDRFGHKTGDAFLCFLAQLIESVFGKVGISCRITADYFAAYLPHELTYLERFTQEYQAQLRSQNLPFEITVSFGLCVVDDATLSAEVALDRAALAQKSVKGNYLNRFAFYDETMRKSRLRQQEIVGQMSAALTQGQFDIYIQPQYDLGANTLIGGEVLARWFHPEKGLIMPAEFIPIFEQNGFISKLDDFVWERACALLQKWLREFGEQALTLSVNISRVNLFNTNVGERLSALTERYGVPPRMLRLEVTESAYAENPQQLAGLVSDLQTRGFTVEMDDFGSGYSSLNVLKDVPVNTLKLDLRFLGGGNTSGRGGSIINSIIRMAKWLLLPVVAEGVETQQQADYLKSIGCDFAQGYLYSRPIPVTEFEALAHAKPHAARSAPFTTNMADANAFWNPDSQETLIFNSYVGGAAIIEYAGSNVTLLRANDKFRSMMRLSDVGRTSGFLLAPNDAMLPEDQALYFKMLEDAIASGDEATCTTRLSDRPGKTKYIWLRNRARVLGRSRSYTIFYVAIDDVSAEYEAQRRYHISQDTLMAAAAHTHLQYWTYNMIEHTSIQGVEGHEYVSGVPNYLENYPQSLLDMGYVHPDYVDAYRKLHTDLQAGCREVSADVMTGGEGKWEWRKVRYTAVTDEDGAVRIAIGTSEELSEYKQLEARFLTAAEQSGLFVWTLDIRARSVSTDMRSVSGACSESCIEDMPEAFIRMGRVHPDDENAFRQLYQQMFSGSSTASCLIRLKTGSLQIVNWRWHRLIFSIVTDKDGSTGIAVGTAVDVDEQVHMQMRYREALNYYESLEANEYVTILHVNVTGGTVDTQNGLVAYSDMLQSLLHAVPVAEERSMLAVALSTQRLQFEYRKGASRFTYEYRLALADGRIRWVRTTVRLLMDTKLQELFAFLYTKDINEERMQQAVFSRIVREDYDFLTIIDTIQDRYSMFVVDENDTFLPSEQEFSFTDGSEVYALQTAHPDDAYTYIRETRIPHMLERLGRDGTYSFIYRSLEPNGQTRKKRITLRMIDEYTRHVCLTRLDIDRLSEVTLPEA